MKIALIIGAAIVAVPVLLFGAYVAIVSTIVVRRSRR